MNLKTNLGVSAKCNSAKQGFPVEKTSLFEFINIADKFVTKCRLVNYFRYFLRFISAYIITVFTIQRTISIYNPIFQNKFSSPKLAWKIIVGLVIVGTI
jgi:hypothetical protein